MEQSLFSFNTTFVTLTSPTPLSSQVMSFYVPVFGVTRVFINYNKLNFTVKPFKIVLNWPYQEPITINDTYKVGLLINPLSTYSPTNSALSYTIITPATVENANLQSSVKIYYENGIIHTFTINFNVFSDNIIDMDLNVLDIQNTDQPFSTVYNLQSNRDNVVYNVIDSQIDV